MWATSTTIRESSWVLPVTTPPHCPPPPPFSYFEGGVIAMPQALSDYQVEYADGTPATLSQMAKDVSTFLRWTSEPFHDDRKRYGIKVSGVLGARAVAQGPNSCTASGSGARAVRLLPAPLLEAPGLVIPRDAEDLLPHGEGEGAACCSECHEASRRQQVDGEDCRDVEATSRAHPLAHSAYCRLLMVVGGIKEDARIRC